jgi:hypothetical protein
MLVMIRCRDRSRGVPLSQPTATNPDDSTRQAIEDRQYGVAEGYCFQTVNACGKATIFSICDWCKLKVERLASLLRRFSGYERLLFR